MKKILVPTDFSENAKHALRYAIRVANYFGSTVTVLNLYEMYSSASTFKSVERYMKEDAARDMLKLIDNMTPLLEGEVKLDSRIHRGEARHVIDDVAKAGDYDMVIMGTQGASGMQEVFLGSTTNAVIKSTKIPVLAVPASWKLDTIQTIVLAVDDLKASHPNVFEPFRKIARVTEAKVWAYHKDTGDGQAPKLETELAGIAYEYYYDESQDEQGVWDSLRSFIHEKKADLVCMVRHEKNFFHRLFNMSNTSRSVFESDVPLLVLHDD